MMKQSMGVTATSRRRSDLDWLRAPAVLLLVPLHMALVFILDPGLVAYVRDIDQATFLIPIKDFLDLWMLDLLFYIAGAASRFAIGHRSSASYLGERVRCLLAPFVFGLLGKKLVWRHRVFLISIRRHLTHVHLRPAKRSSGLKPWDAPCQ